MSNESFFNDSCQMNLTKTFNVKTVLALVFRTLTTNFCILSKFDINRTLAPLYRWPFKIFQRCLRKFHLPKLRIRWTFPMCQLKHQLLERWLKRNLRMLQQVLLRQLKVIISMKILFSDKFYALISQDKS